MFIDKFYRVYSPYTTQAQTRSVDDTQPSLKFNIDNNNWDALKYKISNVKQGENVNDVSTINQTLIRKDDGFVQADNKYEFLEVDKSNEYNAKKRKITNLKPGNKEEDAITLGQSLIRKNGKFEQDKNKYEFLEVDTNNEYNAKKRKITNLKPGANKNDAVTMDQTLIRKDNSFVQSNNKYEFLEVDTNNELNAKKRKITNIKPGVNKEDAVTLDQTLIRKGDGFEQSNNKYEFLEVDINKNEYNAKKRKITNIKPAVNTEDAVTLGQTLIRQGDGFEQGNNKYEFLEVDKTNEYNAKKRKITNIKPGIMEDDVVTVSQIPTIENDKWHFKDKTISHVLAGKDGQDCVVKWQVISMENNKFDGKNKQITNVIPGTLPNDVAVVGQLLTTDDGSVLSVGDKKYEFLKVDTNNDYNAKERKITNLKQGIDSKDAVTLDQTLIRKDNSFVQGENKYEFLEVANNEFDAKQRKITNLQIGVNDGDAVTVSQVPKLFEDKWGFKGKILSGVKGGINNQDCVVKWQAITFDENTKYFDGRNRQISNVKPGTLPNDCVVKDQTITTDELNRNFDGRNKRISNVHSGLFPGDVCTMDQALRYDSGRFVIMGKKGFPSLSFELMNKQDYPKLLVADETALSGFKTLDGKDYLPKNYVFKDASGDLVDSQGGTFRDVVNPGGKVLTTLSEK